MVDKRKFKDTQVSLLGLGTMRLPCKTSVKREANPLISYEKAQALVDMAYENGVNYFDTAFAYPGSEEALKVEIQKRELLEEKITKLESLVEQLTTQLVK